MPTYRVDAKKFFDAIGATKALTDLRKLITTNLTTEGAVMPDTVPYKYSELRYEQGSFYFPVRESDSFVRFGVLNYDPHEAVFCLGRRSFCGHQLVIGDYSKYLHSKLSPNQLSTLNFILQHYRCGRSPKLELAIANKVTEYGWNSVLSTAKSTIPGQEKYLYTNYISKLKSVFLENPLVFKMTETKTSDKLLPLVFIIKDFVDAVSQNVKVKTAVPTNYESWVSEVFEEGDLFPNNFLHSLMDRRTVAMMLIFYTINLYPRVLKKLQDDNGITRIDDDGLESREDTSDIMMSKDFVMHTMCRNLLENLSGLEENVLFSNATGYSPDTTVCRESIRTLYLVNVSNLPSMNVLRQMSATDVKKIIEQVDGGDFYDDVVRAGDVANTGLIPLVAGYSSKDKTQLSESKKGDPGLGIFRFDTRDHKDLISSASYMTAEEDALVGTCTLKLCKSSGGYRSYSMVPIPFFSDAVYLDEEDKKVYYVDLIEDIKTDVHVEVVSEGETPILSLSDDGIVSPATLPISKPYAGLKPYVGQVMTFYRQSSGVLARRPLYDVTLFRSITDVTNRTLKQYTQHLV